MGFTGVQRFSQLGSKKMNKSLQCNENFDKLNELQEISQKAIELFGSESDLQENARLTKLCRDIKLSISNDKNDPKLMERIEETEKAGSLCTRIMGAGGGGFFICWAPEYRHQAIKDSINIKTWVKVKISSTGSQIIFSE